MQSLIGILPIIERESYMKTKVPQDDTKITEQEFLDNGYERQLALMNKVVIEEVQKMCDELQQQDLQEQQRQANFEKDRVIVDTLSDLKQHPLKGIIADQVLKS